MTAKTTVSTTAVRRIAIAAQGYGSRYRRARVTDVEDAIRRLSCVQLDSISTVERSDRIVLTSRTGDYPRDAVSRLLRTGRVFEYWAHEACLISVENWPLFAPAMREGGRRWYGQVERTHPHLAEEILAEIRRAAGLGGQPRAAANDPAERARKSVSARIRDAIHRVESLAPDLAAHLDRSIRTGLRCSYDPAPEDAVDWLIRDLTH